MIQKLFFICVALVAILLLDRTAHGAQTLSGSKRFARQVIVIGGLTVEERYRDRSGEKKHFQTTIAPLLVVKTKTKQQGNTFSLSYSPSLVMNHASSDREVDHDLTANSSGRLAPTVRYQFSERLLRTDRAFDEETITGLLAEKRRNRERYWSQQLDMSATYEYGRNRTVTLGYGHNILKNDADALVDHDKHSPFVMLAYQFTPKWSANGRYEYTVADFDPGDDFVQHNAETGVSYQMTRKDSLSGTYAVSRTDYEGATTDTTIHTVSAGWDRSLSASANASGSIGYSFSEQDNGNSERGLAYSLSVSQKIKNGSVELAGEGGFDNLYFNGVSQGLSRFWGFRGTAAKTLGKNLNGTLFASYRQDTLLAQDPEDRQNSLSVGGGLDYVFYRDYSLNTAYTFKKLTADLGDNDFDEHQASLGIKIPLPDNDYSFAAGYVYRKQNAALATDSLEDHEIFFRFNAEREIF